MSDPILRAQTGPRAIQGLSIKGRARTITNVPNDGGSAATTLQTAYHEPKQKPKALVRHTARSGSPRAESHAIMRKDLRDGTGQVISGVGSRDSRGDRDERDKRDAKKQDGRRNMQSEQARSTYRPLSPEEADLDPKRSSMRANLQSESEVRRERNVQRERSRTPDDRQRHDRDHRVSKSGSKQRRVSDRSRRRRDATESDADDTSENDDEEERRRRRKKRKDRGRHREEKDREDRRRRKKEKERRKSKDDKGKANPTASSTGSWGKHGVISESDLSRMTFEFRAWLVEERRLSPDSLPRDKQKKEFSIFIEDFNTATLPHDKYYNMAAHQAKMAVIRNGGITVEEPKYDPRADEKAHVARLRASHLPDESDLTREEIVELRRLEKERIEAAKRRQLGLEVPKNLGVRMEEKQRELWQDPNLFHS